jgi:predicted membrane-bound mannosyltransferase/sugar lactone lactonase YvrE
MTTTAERLRTYWGGRQFDRERITALAVRYWEVALYGSFVSLALGLRLWHLSGRAIHHDESLHMYYAWQIFKGQGYQHVPFMHGPFKFFSTALVFRLFGDSDFTARLVFALFGSALVGLPYFIRGFLGRAGALFAALLLALSPTLLYVSRFNRDDILVVTYTLAMVIVMWRYLKEQREAYLFAIPLLLMLGFTTMEMTFITTAIFLVYLEYQLANDLLDQIRASRSLSREEEAAAFVVLMLTGWAIAALWPLLDGPRQRWSLKVMPPAAHLLIVLLVFSLPQFSGAVQKIPFVHIGTPNTFDEGRAGMQLKLVTTAIFFLVSIYIGLLWNWRIFLIGAAIFYIPYFLFYTAFFTNGGDIWNFGHSGQFWHGEGGFWTGIWGSLDYWLSQQLVRRGNQPDYYYFMFLPVYELLPLVFAVGGALYYAFKGKMDQKLLSAATVLLVIIFSVIPKSSAGPIGTYHVHAAFIIAIASVLLMRMDAFTKFLLFWTLSVFFALTVAGEKMPWLIVHVALPLTLLAAKVMDDILSSVGQATQAAADARAAQKRAEKDLPAAAASPRGVQLERILPLAGGAALAILAAVIFQASGPGAGLSLIAWLLSLLATGLVVWTAMNASWRIAGQVAAVALFGALFVFTARAAGNAAYDQGDPNGYPREMLIYAQGSPALSVLDADIERAARDSGLGYNLPIVVDSSGNVWPWPWSLRNFHYTSTDFSGDFTPPSGAIVLISNQNQSKMAPYLADYQQGVPYTHMWWFPEFYRGLQTTRFLSDVFNGHTLSVWRNYFIDREVAGASSSPDMIAYFPKSYQSTIIPPPPTGNVSADALPDASVTFIGETGTAPGQYTQPDDITVDAQGNLFVVDTQNHRVQKVAPDGTATAFGKTGSGKSEFGDPHDQSSDYAKDGPWGMAVDAQGNLYVADTWNHRVEKFGPDFAFIKEWGAGELFGPRDIAIDAQGNVYVVDTGNKRIREYTADGVLIKDIGKKGSAAGQFVAGSGPGEFNEPSSIAIAPNGDIYVADFWNKRIQIFDASFRYRTEIKVKSWGSPGITDRAYIVALSDGHVLATDPANGRILVFDPTGNQQAAWRLPSAVGSSRPVGIAVDAQAQNVYISDSIVNHIAKVPLTVLLAPPPAAIP